MVSVKVLLIFMTTLFTTTSRSTKEVATTSPCTVDVAFLIDGSYSMRKDKFEKEKSVVKEIASLLGIPSQSHGAVIVFGTTATLHISFNQSKTQEQFEDLLQNIQFSLDPQWTHIDRALLLAAESVFPYARPNVTKIALVITDGKLLQTQMNNRLSLLNVSKPLHENGVRVLAVGIGSEVDLDELREIVENPSDIFSFKSFETLSTREIVNHICNINAVPERDCLSAYVMRLQDTRNENVMLKNNLKDQIVAFKQTMKFQQTSMAFQQRPAIFELREDSLQRVAFALDDLFNFLQYNTTLGSIPRNLFMCLASKMEEFGLKYSENHFKYSSNSRVLESDRIVFQAKLIVNNNNSGTYALPSTSVNINGATTFMSTTNYALKGTFILSILYKNLDFFLKKSFYNQQEDNLVLGTKVMSVAVNAQTRQLLRNVILRFEKLPSLKSSRTTNHTCVFWNFTSNKEGSWSKEGCTVTRQDKNITECSCNHLTHFAVLMQISDQRISYTENAALSMITYVGLGISLLGCVLTLIMFFAFVNLRTKLSQIRINLVVSIAIAQVVFIAGIDATQNLVGCVAVAALIQYFYLVAFCWMLVEGVQLYLNIVKVFNIEHGMAANYIFAWGFPLIVVTATIIAALTSKEGIAEYVHEEFCWLSFKNKLAWAFTGPILAITLINIILLIHVIREISKMDNTAGEIAPQLNIVRKTAKACAVLFPLLGITWVFGVLTMSGVGVAALYIFTILNSTQGFLIFLLSCVRNSEIRSKLRARVQSLRHSKPTSKVTTNPEEPRSPASCTPPQDEMVMTGTKDHGNSEPLRT